MSGAQAWVTSTRSLPFLPAFLGVTPRPPTGCRTSAIRQAPPQVDSPADVNAYTRRNTWWDCILLYRTPMHVYMTTNCRTSQFRRQTLRYLGSSFLPGLARLLALRGGAEPPGGAVALSETGGAAAGVACA